MDVNLPTPALEYQEQSAPPVIYVGNVKLQAGPVIILRGHSFNPLVRLYTLSRRRGRMVKFHTRIAMEDVIEGGPWLFQGQPIVLQCWEQGMSLRRQQHTHVPVWIRLKHLPMEYWTEEGLSTVASGIGTPLYSDGITKACSRLDYARNTELAGVANSVSNSSGPSGLGKGKAIALYNSYGVLDTDSIEENDDQSPGPNQRSPAEGGS
ncbi:UNVERIFIED_CONTAM: hypothetical protein Sangu_3219500 [Sesamum angustifolium]|uniref:DUF4283 domain-containing protein n=1 Tax=Sesamum angustifolium TaxID=2727405 RepID=A0AAW2JKA3_9LAMI